MWEDRVAVQGRGAEEEWTFCGRGELVTFEGVCTKLRAAAQVEVPFSSME